MKSLPRSPRRKQLVSLLAPSSECPRLISLVHSSSSSSAVAAVQPAEGTEPPPAEIAEFVKGQKDSAAAVSAWSKAVGGGSLAAQWNVLSYYLLPLASPAVKLLFAVASLLNYDVSSLQDVAGDLNWDLFKKVRSTYSFV